MATKTPPERKTIRIYRVEYELWWPHESYAVPEGINVAVESADAAMVLVRGWALSHRRTGGKGGAKIKPIEFVLLGVWLEAAASL